MKKIVSMIMVCAVIALMSGCDNKSDKVAGVPNYTLDYYDAESFESDLNAGIKVNGKIVQFCVNDYKPDSVLGINTWAGEHLNFISQNELDVEKGEFVVGRVTSEPTKTLLGGSWKIPYEVLEIRSEKIEPQPENDNHTEISETTETTIPYEKYTLKVIVDFIPNLIFSTYDVKLEIDGNTETLTHGNDAEFEYRLKEGKYTLTFKSAESSSVKGTVEIDLTGDTEASYKINCYSDRVSVETKYVENKGNVGENEAMVPSSASDCKYENYKDIEKAFKSAGFTNIKTEIFYDIVWGWTKEGEVEKVSINGKTDFKRGDVFAKDAAIVITYHMKEEDDPNKKEETIPDTSTSEKPSPVFYSTNDYETAKKGNTGVFSYKNKSGSYDVYWIIDFDEGYVYWFTEGNGESTCDKLKIVSGTLNDKITVTWHLGGDQWSWYLHFKYVNSPVTLIVNDHNGFATEFTTTDLDDALYLRDTKTIKEY